MVQQAIVIIQYYFSSYCYSLHWEKKQKTNWFLLTCLYSLTVSHIHFCNWICSIIKKRGWGKVCHEYIEQRLSQWYWNLLEICPVWLQWESIYHRWWNWNSSRAQPLTWSPKQTCQYFLRRGYWGSLRWQSRFTNWKRTIEKRYKHFNSEFWQLGLKVVGRLALISSIISEQTLCHIITCDMPI